ncbi:hypothetical protein HT005_18150 [Bacteroides uniformis]|nr:hypothetical protein [Bacteroides uniformis]MBE7617860.1 hypothetical protein [Bacteroides uniformis]
MQTYQHTSMQTCKPITMVIYIAGSIPLFRGKRSNHFRLQRQSKQAAGTATAERQTGRRTARRRVFTEKIP